MTEEFRAQIPTPVRRCLWCGEEFENRKRGGRDKVYCSRDCKFSLYFHARKFVEYLITHDKLKIDTLKKFEAWYTANNHSRTS